MKANEDQITARLAWASRLCSWDNVHPEMKAAAAGLCRRGLMERGDHGSFMPTGAGITRLLDHGIMVCGGMPVPGWQALLPRAEYWTDSWGQCIPV